MRAVHAWGVLMGAVIVYEVLADEGELLSEGVDRALLSHKWLTVGAVLVTAAHLLNVLPTWCDPYAQLARIRL
ncbi:hypothetical protein L3Y21_gp108 [Gordonia phage Rabbitrun]|uniref:Uncharacterized protein n=1 Tax=Gordonia phage Rabbitrun TaxID=2762280 RepID=A0A7G8LIT9_9CAUD|nr:hypothetical protein L3Y21_gp108 [Gordonia phage Rabbitrun]QNJ57161.1 hypothetical protein SEA_RABBITRUN_128 [Gordonia phage Rabbitrun]